jgi:3-oxoacyl-[acyl-carrier protein] reductase
MSKLNGKVAVVTGASKGIGASIAKHLASAGASVVVNYATSKDGADKVVAEIKAAGGKAVAVGGSVANPSEIAGIVGAAKKEFGRLDILVNNAGVYNFTPLEAVTAEDFHRQFNTNVLGLLLTTQEAVKNFGAEGGNVINISSVVARIAPAQASVYSATKGAVDVITKSLAKELGARKIRVNSINPGLVITEGTHTAGIVGSDFEAHFVQGASLGRTGIPQDIATAAVFLASEDSSWMTGQTLEVAGGTQ